MPTCRICGAVVVPAVIAKTQLESCSGCGHIARRAGRPPDYRAHAIAGGYDEARAASQIAFIGPWLHDGMTVFELGCADGALAAHLRKRVAIARYEGLEISPDSELAARILDRVHDDWQTVAETWDLVIASHVLEHLDDIVKTAARLAALIATGGGLFIEVPHGSGHPLLPVDTNPGHLHAFSLESLARLLGGAGLEIVRVADDCFESRRYPRCLRVLSKARTHPIASDRALADRLVLSPSEKLVVWGAGGIARELLLPFFPLDRIAYFVDRDPTLWDTHLDGIPIRDPRSLAAESQVHVLIATLDHEQSVRQQLAREHAAVVTGTTGMRELLEVPADLLG